MGHPETAEPRDRHGLIRGISIVDRAHMEVGSTHVGDPGLLHWFYAPHSAHQEGWLGTCVPVWGFTLPSILHPGLSAGILRGDSAGRWTGGPICISSQELTCQTVASPHSQRNPAGPSPGWPGRAYGRGPPR